VRTDVRDITLNYAAGTFSAANNVNLGTLSQEACAKAAASYVRRSSVVVMVFLVSTDWPDLLPMPAHVPHPVGQRLLWS
jgi:hypothetical protein